MQKDLKNIYKSITNSRDSIDNQNDYPVYPGIYCFFLSKESSLKEFGKGNQILYIGIAKHSLKNRDLNMHFRTGRTGSSTLRRSIGAILKDELKLIAIPRGDKNDSKRIDNYKFEPEGDERLTQWMIENLEIGYWVDRENLQYSKLREYEEELTRLLKPILDLDRRTRRFNPLADKLTCLRNKCKMEVCEYIEKFEN